MDTYYVLNERGLAAIEKAYPNWRDLDLVEEADLDGESLSSEDGEDTSDDEWGGSDPETEREAQRLDSNIRTLGRMGIPRSKAAAQLIAREQGDFLGREAYERVKAQQSAKAQPPTLGKK